MMLRWREVTRPDFASANDILEGACLTVEADSDARESDHLQHRGKSEAESDISETHHQHDRNKSLSSTQCTELGELWPKPIMPMFYNSRSQCGAAVNPLTFKPL